MSIVQFNSKGFALSSGNVEIYQYDVKTSEFITASNVFILVGFGLPAYSTTVAPPDKKIGYATVWNGSSWSYSEDHRGTTIYNTTDQTKTVITSIGPIPDGYTTSAPNSSFDKWDGTKWVLDTAAEDAAIISSNKSKKSSLISLASNQISMLTDLIDAGIPGYTTDQLNSWKTYRVKLIILDVTSSTSVTWPTQPVKVV